MMLGVIATLVMSTVSAAQSEVPREFRGVWVATVDNIDWPSKKDLSTATQKQELEKIVDVVAQLNMNAIVFQVRPTADALFESKLEPWSEWLTGSTGKAPSPRWDPLAFLVEKAHARGIEVHAWFNPYRAYHPKNTSPVSKDHISVTHPKSVVKYGKYLWMDPSDPYVQKHSRDVMLDVARRYDVDGIHMDDYFYPYPERDADKKLVDFPDEANYRAYQKRGGTLSRGDWRRKQVDDFVQTLYQDLKKLKPWVKMGISPFGIYRPGIPATTTAGVDQYDQLYADCRKWLAEGWCDYFTPQLYWKIAQTLQSYPVLLDWWLEQNSAKRHIWPGNYTGQISGANWPVTEVLDQIRITREKGGGGNVHFSMKVFLQNAKSLNEALKKEAYAERALVPASPWLSSGAVPTPKNVRATAGEISFAPDAKMRWAVLVAEDASKSRILARVPASIGKIEESVWKWAIPGVQWLQLIFVDRAGVAGPAVRIPMPR